MNLGTLKLENNLFLAPLAGITDTIFRVIVKRYGCGLVFSEMINSNGILNGGVEMRQKLDIHPEEGQVGIQIAGDDPKTLAEAAQRAVDAGAVTVNINMGCPAKKVTKNQAGCALMKNPDLVRKIIRGVKKSISVPLSIKIRLGWDNKQKNYLEISKIAESEGCVAVFMHARTRMDAFKGQANWKEITKLKSSINIPVIGNGDITTPQKGFAMINQTGCDGIMIGRGALGQPWIFRQILEARENKPIHRPTLIEKKDLMLDHLEMSLNRYGVQLGLRLMQKHFSWYSKGIPGSAKFRNDVHQLKEDLSATKTFIDRFFDTVMNAQQMDAKRSLKDSAVSTADHPHG